MLEGKPLEKYLQEGGSLDALKTASLASSPEFVSGEKKLDLRLNFEDQGELTATQDDRGIVSIEISGQRGSINLLEFIKQIDQSKRLWNLKIVSPIFISRLPDVSRYNKIKEEVKKAPTIFYYIPIHGLYFPEPFIVVGEPKDPKIWLLGILHESGHAIDLPNSEISNREDPDTKSKQERMGWANALKIIKAIKEKTGFDLLSIFGSLEEVQKVIHSMLLAYRASYTKSEKADIADSKELFDKGKLKRLK